MEFILGLYLVGYFLSVGIVFSFREENEPLRFTIGAAIFVSLLSWIAVGLAFGDMRNEHHQPENKNK